MEGSSVLVAFIITCKWREYKQLSQNSAQTHRFGRFVNFKCEHNPQTILLVHSDLQTRWATASKIHRKRTSGIPTSLSSAQLSSSHPSPLDKLELTDQKHGQENHDALVQACRRRAPDDLESFSPNRNEALGAAFLESDET
jgi:hypothetical protein